MRLPKVNKGWIKNLRKLQMVQVTWEDATVIDGWTASNTIDKYSTIEVLTVGWLLPPTKTELRLGYSIASNGTMNEIFLIPKKWVKKVKVIK